MPRAKSVYAPGKNPASLANLQPNGGRTPIYGEKKKKHGITITDTAWEKVKEIAKDNGCNAVSEFLELLGREEIILIFPNNHQESKLSLK